MVLGVHHGQFWGAGLSRVPGCPPPNALTDLLRLTTVMLLATTGGPKVTGIGANVYHVLGWTGLALAVILLLRVLLAIFHIEAEARNAVKALGG